MICGLDNGLDGGVTILSPHGSIIAKRVMPTQERDGKSEINVVELRDWIVGATGDNSHACHFVIEKPVGSKSANAAKSMAASFHAIRGMFDTKGWSWERIAALTWQDALGIERGNTKESAFLLASKLWPDEEWLRNKRCRTPHDGMIDAALIAEYTRTK